MNHHLYLDFYVILYHGTLLLTDFVSSQPKFLRKKKKNQLLRPRHRLAAAIHCHLGRGFLGDLIRTVAGGGFYLGFQSRYVRQQKKNYNKLSSSLQQQPIAGNFSC
mmetsp:Transcript_2138/g.2786  ORF Transcript_2138/g.2786 Transcript_2138/m.2786 type:complete len:106 (+) Transcript_2138:435-752(+)